MEKLVDGRRPWGCWCWVVLGDGVDGAFVDRSRQSTDVFASNKIIKS